MKPIAWYDPTNGMVSTDKDSPLFTPLGQVWPLYLPSTWAGLTDEEIRSIAKPPDDIEILMTGRMWIFVGDLMEKLKEKNT